MVHQLIGITILLAISIAAARSQQIETSSMCEGKEINSFVPDPDNCSKFFQCNGDTFIHGSCPTGMFYHPQDVCSFDDTNCSSSTEQTTTSSSSSTTEESNVTSSTVIPEPSSTTAAPTDPEQWCADVDPNRPHFIKSPTQCSEYYICVNGKAILQKCQEGKYWSAKHFYCDDPKNVPCAFDRIPNPEQFCNTSAEDEISFTASPTDCGEYYICVKRLPFLMRCAPGSHWNDDIKQCDDPRIAGCKVRRKSDKIS
ncbi:putative mucin-like protein [Anopheles sinensis]|uniref:Putative mucin-like protein n=1 Tax=Anopheles sinensis TaxID=74873 RepID=A0A084VUN8_ANOSI|nr:putative mucin-like protein [Anopheles sinensis]